MKLKERAKQLKQDIPAVFLALNEKDTPVIAKIFAGITIAYALSPIDFISDFIPIIGYLDDLIILPLFVTVTVKLIPYEIMQQCKVKATGMWEDGKPKKWYYAIPIILIWALIIFLIVKCFI